MRAHKIRCIMMQVNDAHLYPRAPPYHSTPIKGFSESGGTFQSKQSLRAIITV